MRGVGQRLGIDFGTSSTVAVLSQGGNRVTRYLSVSKRDS
jgi:N-acetylglucosamine kinase-like BadF-type ATPase